jgi:predicted ArsR family transcriptional regulator
MALQWKKLTLWLSLRGRQTMAMRPFLTNHGAVLIVLAQHGQITARRMAEMLGLTERLIYSIIVDLEAEGYVSKQRVGRCNHYQVHVEKLLPRSVCQDVTVGEMLRGMRVLPGEETDVPTQRSRHSQAGTDWCPEVIAGRVSDLYFHWEVCHGDSTIERRCPWYSFP